MLRGLDLWKKGSSNLYDIAVVASESKNAEKGMTTTKTPRLLKSFYPGMEIAAAERLWIWTASLKF